jgi:hypothetical protein
MITKLDDDEKILKTQEDVIYYNPTYEFAGEGGNTPDVFGIVLLIVNLYLTTSRLILETTNGEWGTRCVEGVTREIPITAIKKINVSESKRFLGFGPDEALTITIENFEEYNVSDDNNINIGRSKSGKEWVDFFEKNKEHLIKREIERMTAVKIKKAKKHEKLLEFDEAAEMYKDLGMDDEAIRIRKLKAEQGAVKVSQKVVHGDEVTKTEIKDSVLNRSNVGAGGKSKAEELREAKSLFEEGLIDDDEFKLMKKEILGK